MPATEQTWYNLKLLHVVFGFSSIAMFIATVWMFAADHDREWKGYQRRFRELEQRLTDWRIQSETAALQQTQLSSLERQLAEEQTQAPDGALVAEFKRLILHDQAERGELSEEQLAQELQAVDRWLPSASPEESAGLQGRFRAWDRDYAELQKAEARFLEQRDTVDEAEQQLEQLRQDVAQAHQEFASLGSLPQGESRLQQLQTGLEDKLEVHSAAQQNMARAKNEAEAIRNRFVNALQSEVDRARFREDQLTSRRKFRSADADAAKANLDLAIRDGLPAEDLQRLQAIVDEILTGPDGVQPLTLQQQDAAGHRRQLQEVYRQLTADEESLAKAISEKKAEIARLEGSQIDRRSTFFVSQPPFLGKRWLELPILDAFSSPLQIDNLWTEGLTIANGSFGKVRRFDRCTTCHRGIDKTQPGSATEPAYLPEQQFDITLQTPESAPEPELDERGRPKPLSLEQVYGLTLAGYGLVEDNSVTINGIRPESLAARAVARRDAHGRSMRTGLLVGDVIEFINGDRIASPAGARLLLVDSVEWGTPITLTIRRGLPQPYTSHPRLDLFVGSLSPHSLAVMGCTACHEGQGSATSFDFASHTPNDVQQEEEWRREHGWFHNHHWIYPMYPRRLAESACLKCHHEVVELDASERFPEPPAGKVVEGWRLVSDLGCYGCHEIQGYEGPQQRVGPDMRLEPNYFAAAAALRADPNFGQLDAEVQAMTELLEREPFRDDVRHRLRDVLRADAAAETPQLSPASQALVDVLQDQETPGDQRKAGPSLRYVAQKLNVPFLYDWIRDPTHFRPSTKMPRFFGLWDHLEGSDKQLAVDNEKIEILGMVTYLLNRSQPFSFLSPVAGAEPPSAERGRLAFELRGCLACHQHQDFPYATATQGPELSHLGDKFVSHPDGPDAAAWLYSWIKRPTHYHARTRMPDLYLDPERDAEGRTVDPVADMVAFLLGSSRGWQPAPESLAALQPDPAILDRLVLENLQSAFTFRRAEEYAQRGIPESLAESLTGAEAELLGEINEQKKLVYVGRTAIARYGCFACHDIPGFENAKPIGTAIADWGRKDPSQLAFEHILEYLHHHADHGHSGPHATDVAMDSGPHAAEEDAAEEQEDAEAHTAAAGSRPTAEAAASAEEEAASMEAFFQRQLMMHDRSGFLWQKLKAPRSYDYKKTANKRYAERLRMPQFNLSPQQREAVMTFVLGLVASPPNEAFVYRPAARQAAIVQGRKVLEKYNCGGCHILEPERWDLEFEPGELGSVPTQVDFPFLQTRLPAERLQQSLQADRLRGFLQATARGMPAISNDDGSPLVYDEFGDELYPDEEYDPQTLQYAFQLWSPMALEGEVYEVGLRRLVVPAQTIKNKWSARGGDLTRWLLPRVIEVAKEANPAANGTEAWAWLPPPLHNEGGKVQPGWLHDFLMEPYTIRPATFLRMPKFNLSPDEATQLVNYFAAMDSADYPFEYHHRQLASHLPRKEAAFAEAHATGQTRLEHAMRIVIDQNYCVKCHSVGDFMPASDIRALAPNLADVGSRLRPDYLRNWIANPVKILPYTAMPVNVPYDPQSETLGGVSQELFPGDSPQQIEGLTDLLMHFSTYSNAQHSVTELVQGAAAGAATPAAEAEVEPSADDAPADEEAPSGVDPQTDAALLSPAGGGAVPTGS